MYTKEKRVFINYHRLVLTGIGLGGMELRFLRFSPAFCTFVHPIALNPVFPTESTRIICRKIWGVMTGEGWRRTIAQCWSSVLYSYFYCGPARAMGKKKEKAAERVEWRRKTYDFRVWGLVIVFTKMRIFSTATRDGGTGGCQKGW